jgi:hypothetical protein
LHSQVPWSLEGSTGASVWLVSRVRCCFGFGLYGTPFFHEITTNGQTMFVQIGGVFKYILKNDWVSKEKWQYLLPMMKFNVSSKN